MQHGKQSTREAFFPWLSGELGDFRQLECVPAGHTQVKELILSDELF